MSGPGVSSGRRVVAGHLMGLVLVPHRGAGSWEQGHCHAQAQHCPCDGLSSSLGLVLGQFVAAGTQAGIPYVAYYECEQQRVAVACLIRHTTLIEHRGPMLSHGWGNLGTEGCWECHVTGTRVT